MQKNAFLIWMTIEKAIPIAIKKKPIVVLKKILKVRVPIMKISIEKIVFLIPNRRKIFPFSITKLIIMTPAGKVMKINDAF